MKPTSKLIPAAQRAYVGIMMDVIGRGLTSASQIDPEIHEETKGFPTGFTVRMTVFPHGPSFTAQSHSDGSLRLIRDLDSKPNLTVTFKHISHAFLVFSFQESTTQAFANDRMVADGDVGHAVRLVRCLNKMEALILPKIVAKMAVKQYPTNLSLKEKLTLGSRIYLKVAQTYLDRS